MKRNRRSAKKSATLSITILISIIFVGSASAGWVPLTGDLVPVSSIPTGGLQVGDKLFTEFEVTGISSGGPPTPSASTVLAQGGFNDSDGDKVRDPDEDYGLRFRLAWNAGTDQLINANINFKSEILASYPDWYFTDAALFLAVAGATGEGLVDASEMIYDADFMGNCLAALCSSVEAEDGGANLIDDSLLKLGETPVEAKEIWVRTGVIVRGGTGANAGTANLSEVFVLYSQVPEPATIMMLGLGALALLRRRRR